MRAHRNEREAREKKEGIAVYSLDQPIAGRLKKNLYVAYEKYKTHLETCQTYERKVADGSWTGSKLTAVDLIQLFISKCICETGLHMSP